MNLATKMTLTLDMLSTTSSSVILRNTMQMMGFEGDNNKDDYISMDSLYPALIQCFSVIICG